MWSLVFISCLLCVCVVGVCVGMVCLFLFFASNNVKNIEILVKVAQKV